MDFLQNIELDALLNNDHILNRMIWVQRFVRQYAKLVINPKSYNIWIDYLNIITFDLLYDIALLDLFCFWRENVK